jgi:peptidoglycan/xylan/chitin deacetylase (PgdA/CDA1 family)
MKRGIKVILGLAGGWISPSALVRITGQYFLFPFYHTVSNTPLPHVNQVYNVRSLASFKKDLDFLTRHYQPVGLEELRAFRKGGRKLSKPCMFLTFDDGLSGIYDVIAPELLKRGIPAAFFINTDFIDNQDLFFRYKASLILDRLEHTDYPQGVLENFQRRFHLLRAGRINVRELVLGVTYRRRTELDEMAKLVDIDFKAFLKVKKPYLTSTQISELVQTGFYFGAHSKDHPLFKDLVQDDQVTQYRDSLTMIQQEFGLTYGLFSFPFTDDGVTSSFFNALSAEGMPPLDTTFGTAGLKEDPVDFHFQRIPMEIKKLPASRILKGEYLYYLLKGLLGKDKISRG